MRGMSGFRYPAVMRRLPRWGRAGGCRGFVPVPGLHGRRSRHGTGRGGTPVRLVAGRAVRTAVPCFLAVRTYPGRGTPARSSNAPCPAARSLPAPSTRRDKRRPAALRCGCRKAPLASSRRRHSRRPVQGRAQGGGVQPQRLEATARKRRHYREACELGSDDAVRRRIDDPETRAVRGFSQPGAERTKSAGKCQSAKTPFFSRSAKKTDADVRPCPQGGIGCPISGARGHFAMRD